MWIIVKCIEYITFTLQPGLQMILWHLYFLMIMMILQAFCNEKKRDMSKMGEWINLMKNG